MAITNFIPELWSALLLEQWNNTNVFSGLVNRDYEGVAARGNKVNITGVVAPTVKDYKTGDGSGARTTSADAISDTGVDLLIDQEKSIDFYVDDIDRAQAAGSLEAYTLAGAEAWNLIAKALKELTQAGVPTVGRVVVANPDFAYYLRTDSSKLTSVDTSGDSEGLRGGTIGAILGARVVESANLPADGEPQFVAFHQRAAAYVSQIDQVEALRAENKFADRIRALHVYGGKVVRPTGVRVFNQDGS